MMKLFHTKDSKEQFKGQEEPSRFDEPTVYRRVLGFVRAKRELLIGFALRADTEGRGAKPSRTSTGRVPALSWLSRTAAILGTGRTSVSGQAGSTRSLSKFPRHVWSALPRPHDCQGVLPR